MKGGRAACRRISTRRAVLVALAAIGAGFAWHASAITFLQVSQKDRSFQPGTAEIGAGQVLRIVNDDGELLHHAYVKSSEFNFDSGEQEPGGHVDIVFPTAGHYTVLCGIHPKMHLAVTVK